MRPCPLSAKLTTTPVSPKCRTTLCEIGTMIIEALVLGSPLNLVSGATTKMLKPPTLLQFSH